MKKRTAKPFYDKQCQRAEQDAAKCEQASATLLAKAKVLRTFVASRLHAKQVAAGAAP